MRKFCIKEEKLFLWEWLSVEEDLLRLVKSAKSHLSSINDVTNIEVVYLYGFMY